MLKNFDQNQNYYKFYKRKNIPIVFIHGVGLDHEMWFPQVRSFKYNSILVYDLLGHGKTPLRKKTVKFEDFSNQLNDLLKYLNINKINLVGFSFGSLIAMQLLMRRPEINRFIVISPQPNVYDFSFLSPCPTSGLMIYGKKDELVPVEHIKELEKRLSAQKGIKVEFQSVAEANHFFSKNENMLTKCLDKYIKKETALY